MAQKEYDHDPGDDPDVSVLMWDLTNAQWKKIRALIKDPKSLFDSYRAWQDDAKTQREKHKKRSTKS